MLTLSPKWSRRGLGSHIDHYTSEDRVEGQWRWRGKQAGPGREREQMDRAVVPLS